MVCVCGVYDMMCVWCVTVPGHVGVAACVFFSVCAKYVRNFTHICTLLQDICISHNIYILKKSGERGLLQGVYNVFTMER